MSHSPRYSELRQLVLGDNGLTPEEARYVKFLLYDMHTDLISELPLELIVLVALELELHEFQHCLSVSKAWRRRFLSDSVILAYANRRWPAIIDGVMTQSRFLEILTELRVTPSGSLENGMIYRNSRQWLVAEEVRFDNKTHFTLDPVFHSQLSNVPDVYTRYSMDPDGIEKLTPFYASGKVAWHIPGRAILIDDLRSKTRKVFTPPSGTMRGSSLELRSLGSRLAIGTINRLLIAFDHVDNRSYEKSLSGRVLQCATQNSRVAIVLYGGDVITWTPNHAATHLDLSRLILGLAMNPRETESWKKHLNVSFDPRNSKILYLTSSYHFETKCLVRVTVHEFQGSVHIASWSFDYGPVSNEVSLSSDYEIDYGCILFYLDGQPPFAVFDKIKRKFVDVSYYGGRRFFNSLYLDYPEQLDLDFKVRFRRQGYEFLQLTLRQNTCDKEHC
ncbi:hypothetical protein FHL15_004481 [Xylaria flabelliformis]|uniref:F-box domain-containing protein n=1 Tax=Xylaria flabelliformis TaxID=2512241 RepID=A0A553I3C9_9PEZI|nr:hypothetical protein FHL15_004481 [Xylaria flabelliformis]